MAKVTVVEGTVIHSPKLGVVEFLRETAVCFDPEQDGKIVLVCPCADAGQKCQAMGLSIRERIKLKPGQFVVPGFVDAHIHAPQCLYAGTGYDLQLLDWLATYTYPAERRYEDPAFCEATYAKAVRRCLLYGTTTACYFATIHVEGTKRLADVVKRLGQRALVGKVNMDCNSPDYYVETLEDSVRGTEEVIDYIASLKWPLVEPVVTPRFAVTCSEPLLKRLGELVGRTGAKMQSHINENTKEVALVSELFPHHRNAAQVFDSTGLLGAKSIMAHCIYMKDEELQLFRDKGVGVVHCPTSNSNIRSGILDTRRLLDMGMKVGMGTDVAGGHTFSMLETMRHSVQCSNLLSLSKQQEEPQYSPISHKEAFYLATTGSARVLNLEDKIGTIEVGKQFDALIVDAEAVAGPIDFTEADSLEDLFMKFIFLGDDRNIASVYVAGREVKAALCGQHTTPPPNVLPVEKSKCGSNGSKAER